MYSLILVSTLVIISGLIAFVGDWVGLKIGKKRVTIFGLRPHYTAIFVTVISGINPPPPNFQLNNCNFLKQYLLLY